MKECSNCNLCFDDEYYQCPHDNTSLYTSHSCKTTLGNRYVLERKLGKGGMGAVYKAKHRFLKSLHAIKIISPELVVEDESLLVRFRQEAILAASIHHPNVVNVTDFGIENENTPYLVMEYIEGIGLDEFLKREGRLSPIQAFKILKPIALGVAEAHKKGIIHRDLKPLNVMLSYDKNHSHFQEVKVLDFGLAKIKSSESFVSLIQAKTTNLLGSPHFMSPEQWSNEGVDTRSDIYSLGIILFQMLVGDVPFKGNSIPAIMYQHLQNPMPSLAALGVSVSPQIESVLQKALAKEQNDRYSTTEEFLFQYEDALLSTSGQAIHSKEYIDRLPDFPPQTVKVKTTSEIEISSGKDFGKTYNLTYLNSVQNQTLANYFNQPKPQESDEKVKLEQQFLQAQNQLEAARTRADEAEKLALEFNAAQKAAEDAHQKVLQAQQKLEHDAQRRMQAEMERKLAVEKKAREKAEAEAHLLNEEVKARKEAEERANKLAKTALEAQQRVEVEKLKAEREIHQRELEAGTRRKAEAAALKLAEEVAEAKIRYEEAKKQAENEAYFRMEAELKHKKINDEILRIAQYEAEKRRLVEEQAAKQIKEQVSRLEAHATEAEKKATEARLLAESEAKKREEAETARIKAEEEARRLAEEIIEAQKQLEAAHQLAKLESEKRSQEEAARKKAEASIRSLTASQHTAESLNSSQQKQYFIEIPDKTSSPKMIGEETSGVHGMSFETIMVDTSSNDVSNTGQMPVRNKKLTRLFLTAGAATFLLFVGLVGIFVINSIIPRSAITESESKNTATENTNLQPTVPERVTKKMVFTKGGIFLMGRDDVQKDDLIFGNQFPAKETSVGSFYIDRSEISNAEYAEFIKDSGHKMPQNWLDGKPVTGQENLPVTNVSKNDADKFADWISKRVGFICNLPSESEWEYTARNGSYQNQFPWGNEWLAGRANIDSGVVKEAGVSGDLTAVGDVQDMMGNVLEWTSTNYEFYPNIYTVRGASFLATQKQLENKHLLLTFRQGLEADKKYPYLGFRLVCKP